jgi:hypothetical protein
MGKRRRGGRGSSNAGRPKKEGERFPNGQLKARGAVGPTAEMVAKRKVLAADGTKSTCPLDAAVAQGWLTEDQQKAGRLFASLYRKADTQGPRLARVMLPETVTSVDVRDLKFAQLSDEEIVAIWDAVFTGNGGAPMTREQMAVNASKLWQRLAWAMRPKILAELHAVCIQEQWPSWLLRRIETKAKREAIINLATAEKRAVTEAELAELRRPMPDADQMRLALLREGLALISEGQWRRDPTERAERQAAVA